MSDFDPHSYSVMIKRVDEDGESVFKATVKELPHVAEYGDSYEEVYELAVDAINVLHEMASDMGHKFPNPSTEDENYSGRVTLRMPKSLHRSVAATADLEGVSLNQFLVATIAERVSSGNFNTELVGRIEKRLVSSRVTTLLRDLALIDFSSLELTMGGVANIIGDIKDVSVKETAVTTESALFNNSFDESKLLDFQRS